MFRRGVWQSRAIGSAAFVGLVTVSAAVGSACSTSVSVSDFDDPAGSDAGADGGDTAVVDGAVDSRPDTATTGGTGDPCKSDKDCLSRVCSSLGICTSGCKGKGDCPAGPSWDCVSLPGKSGGVCECKRTALSDIACNKIDDDCNGKVDEFSTTCEGVCIDTGVDPNNCGACGFKCGGGTICREGKCGCPSSKSTICATSCVDTTSDVNNCGACGKVCKGVGAPGLSATCEGSTCVVKCVAGLADCDGDPSNGCEKDVLSDNNNCGACGKKCAVGRCSGGVCATETPVDVTLLVDTTGSTQPELSAAEPHLARLVKRLTAEGVFVGVSVTADFPVAPYGQPGDMAFRGLIEPSNTVVAPAYPKMSGNDTADGMIEALGSLAGLPVHPTSTALSCTTGRVAGGCWRPEAQKVIVLYTDDQFHNGPGPDSDAIFEPYTLVVPAPQTWEAVKSALIRQKITLIILRVSKAGDIADRQYTKMFKELGQPATNIYPALGAEATTAVDAVITRLVALRKG